MSRTANTLIAGLAMAALGFAVAASSVGRAEAKDLPPLGDETIVYAHGQWGSGRTVTEAVSILLERMGYTVEQKLLDTGLAYQALAEGEADLWSSAFLPGQQQYFNKRGDQLDIISMSYTPVPAGLMVPAYMQVDTIEDLQQAEVRESLDGKITGIDAGAGVVIQANKAVTEYGLDYEVVTSSSSAMASAFKAAYEKKEPIVATGWCPHVLCSLYQVKFLEDPKGKFFGDNRDFHVANTSFRADHPRAASLVGRMTFTEGQVSDMLVWMDKKGLSAREAAERFLEENPDLEWYWAGDLIPDMKKPKMLAAEG